MPTDFTPIREPDGSLSVATQQAITKQLYEWLDEYSIEQSPAEHRDHLGVSVIGEKCSRKLWYGFRWVKLEQHEPRIRRLFKRGHYEEEKFTNILLWMGFHTKTIDEATGKQYKFSAISGHYGGSGDTIALLPWFRDMPILVEYKTHNKKYFTELKAKGLKVAQPKHFTQMSGYGKAFKTRYGLYLGINKDDDEIHFEFLELDWQLATLMEKKAADIISSQVPPPRIAEDPSWFDCKWCHKAGICWRGEKVEVNCRSCVNASPINNGKWTCKLYGVIPDGKNGTENWLIKGCPQHTSINQ